MVNKIIRMSRKGKKKGGGKEREQAHVCGGGATNLRRRPERRRVGGSALYRPKWTDPNSGLRREEQHEQQSKRVSIRETVAEQEKWEKRSKKGDGLVD